MDKSFQGPVIYIRHAESLYNHICTEKDLKGESHYNDKFGIELVDCSISNEGLNQIKSLVPKLQEIKARYIFTSPLNRSIQTLYHSLKDHPLFHQMIIFVHPLLSEKICSSCDLSERIENKIKKFDYLKLDFGFFDKLYNKETRDYYFTDFFFNFNKGDILPENYEENMTNIINLMKKNFDTKKESEDLNTLYRRSTKFKEFLKEFLLEKGLEEDEKVLVFTHSTLIQMSTSEMVYTISDIQKMPQDAYFPSNCEGLTIKIK